MSAGERYVELVLRLARHEPQLVDSYHGPPELAHGVEIGPPIAPADLAVAAEGLLPEADIWLAAQIGALAAVARRLAGERLAYEDEIELVYGARPQWVDESVFEEAHGALDEALPGTGAVRERYARWLDSATIPPELVGPAVEAMLDALREWTRQAVGLPDGEEVELALVRDRPWRGFARQLGGLRSWIAINLDRQFPANMLAYLIAHEVYPGHHTHFCWKESELAGIEHRVDVMWCPEATITEGIGVVASALVGGSGELTARILRPLGVDYDAELGARVVAAERALHGVTPNLALLIHGRGAGRDDAVEYGRRWMVRGDTDVERLVDRLLTRPSPGYVHTYAEGGRLCGAYCAGDPRRLRKLMTAQYVPAQLSGGLM